MQVEISNGDFVIDARLLGRLLDLPVPELKELMRSGAVTSVCERGQEAHEGQYRLSFFYGNRRLRLTVDTAGQVLQHSTVDFGERPLPPQLHRPGD